MENELAVLVIDDNPDDRSLYLRVLKRAFGDRLKCVEEHSGEGGLDAIERSAPSCVLLDYSLPGRDGVEILKRIRLTHRYLPVILLTGQGNEAVAVQSMKEGAQDYITKADITAESLGKVIRMAVDNCALQKRVDDQRAALELFANTLAHDLKEPVRSIRSFAQMICDGGIEDGVRETYFRYIRDAGDRMALLIESVFLFTQLDGQIASRRGHVSLNEALAAATANLAALIGERGAVVSADPMPIVVANRSQIIQLLQNLVSNAISHCTRPVRISVAAAREGDTVRVLVRDDGPGIAPEHQAQIFEPFRRLNRDNAHTGLGLSISRKIVEMHAGKIGCESVSGGGACFYFTLPCPLEFNIAVPIARADGVEAQAPVESAKLANVLLVDDRDDDVYLTRTHLTGRHGMQCNFLVAHDGKKGLAAMREQRAKNDPVDLILLDINMPFMNGFEMLEAMRNSGEHTQVPVVMCSGSTQEKDKERARALGAVDYLEKPVRFEQLEPIISKSTRMRLTSDAIGRLTLLRVA